MANNYVKYIFDDEFVGDSLNSINYNIYATSTLLYNISSALLVDNAFTSTDNTDITDFVVSTYPDQSLYRRLNTVYSLLTSLSSLDKFSNVLYQIHETCLNVSNLSAVWNFNNFSVLYPSNLSATVHGTSTVPIDFFTSDSSDLTIVNSSLNFS